MEIEGGRAALACAERRGAPYVAAVELKAAAETRSQHEPESAAPPRWIKPLSCYERRETTIVEGLRYG
jgi:hypothetical protein